LFYVLEILRGSQTSICHISVALALFPDVALLQQHPERHAGRAMELKPKKNGKRLREMLFLIDPKPESSKPRLPVSFFQGSGWVLIFMGPMGIVIPFSS
jgi:hypothetical protein